jgi:hypothetical protein
MKEERERRGGEAVRVDQKKKKKVIDCPGLKFCANFAS